MRTIILILFTIQMFGQNKLSEQYFFNEAVKAIILESSKANKYYVIECKNVYSQFPDIYNSIDTSRCIEKICFDKEKLKLADNTNFYHQYPIRFIDEETAKVANLDKLEYVKIYLSDAQQLKHYKHNQYIIFFHIKYEFETDIGLPGYIIGTFKDGKLAPIEYYDMFYSAKGVIDVPLIEIDK